MYFGKVTKKVTHEKHGEREIEFTVPQIDKGNVEELVQFYNGPDELVDRMNKIIARSAPQTGILRLQKSDAATLEEYEKQIAKEQENAKSYKPEAGGPSVKSKAEGVDRLNNFATEHRDLFQSMQPDEMLAFLTTGVLPERITAQLETA